jgi:hypothetical protein
MQHSGQKGGKVGVLDAPPKERRRGGQTTDFLREDVHKFGRRIGPAVRQVGLEVIPHAFVGVQLRGVGREGFQVQPRRVAEELLHRFAVMDPAIVQEYDEVAGDLAQQGAEEGHDLVAPDVVLIQMAVQRAMGALRADGDARDGRDAVVRVPVAHDRRLPDRPPRLADRGDQEEARLVDKDEVGPQPRGVFFTRGQADCFQVAMAASLRSTARRSGVWWLQPSWCRSLPTWFRW